MKTKFLYLLAISLLGFLSILFIYKNFKREKENEHLRQLLSKAERSIYRDNKNHYDNLWSILNNQDFIESRPYVAKGKYFFDSILEKYQEIDSTNLSKNLITIVSDQLKLTDSIYSFASNWCTMKINWEKYTTLEALEHKPTYKFGDTQTFTYRLVSTIGFEKSAYEIISYTPKVYGLKMGNKLIYSVPISKLVSFKPYPQDTDFEYSIAIKNNYTKSIDTSYSSVKLQIIP